MKKRAECLVPSAGERDKSIPLSIRLYNSPVQVRRVLRTGRIAFCQTLYYHPALAFRRGNEVTVKKLDEERIRVTDAMGLLVCVANAVEHLEVGHVA
jgi:hypothetical protein